MLDFIGDQNDPLNYLLRFYPCYESVSLFQISTIKIPNYDAKNFYQFQLLFQDIVFSKLRPTISNFGVKYRRKRYQLT